MSSVIVTHQRRVRRKSRTLALIERDTHALRTRVYAKMALRLYFIQMRAEMQAKLNAFLDFMEAGRP